MLKYDDKRMICLKPEDMNINEAHFPACKTSLTFMKNVHKIK